MFAVLLILLLLFSLPINAKLSTNQIICYYLWLNTIVYVP